MFNLKQGKAKVCHCCLNQSAMDFEGNKSRIIDSIKFARQEKCFYRVGPEMEVPGYSCDDHFKEIDLYHHCWEVVADILREGLSDGIVIDLGMPVIHRSVAYNCKIILYNGKVVLIRPKMHLADEENYREKRYFIPYQPPADLSLDTHYLPDLIREITGESSCPFGYSHLRFRDGLIGIEICEEVWRINSKSRPSYLNCDIIMSSSASHFQTNKMQTRFNMIKELIQKSDGTYIYCNLLGFDGGSVYFDGANMAISKEGILQYTKPCSFRESVSKVLVVNILQTKNDRLADINFMDEAAQIAKIPEIFIDMNIAHCEEPATPVLKDFTFEDPAKQHMLAASGYLWDYMRKSGASGLFLPLSGGADSGITALIVYYMCFRLEDYISRGATDVLKNLQKVIGDDTYVPTCPKDICKRLFSTCYMGSENSSSLTRKRARDLAEFVGSDHSEVEIDGIANEFKALIKKFFDVILKFQAHGGTWQEDIAIQNLYARIRMVLSYLLAQLTAIKKKTRSFYLVLACGNLDETLTGYYTKYDCSSGDLNLIGSMSKVDIKNCLKYLHKTLGAGIIKDILEAKATAELKPSESEQTDEQEIGLTFDEIEIFADARITKNCSVLYFYRAVEPYFPEMSKDQLVEKVTTFFRKYAANRHKCETLTTSVHLTSKNCSSKRYDLRPMVYADMYKYELSRLRELVLEDGKNQKKEPKAKSEIESKRKE